MINGEGPLQISAMPDLRAMKANIRRASPRDVPAMLALVKELAIFEKEPEALTVTQEEMHEAGFGKKPLWFGWVAEQPGAGTDTKQPATDHTLLGMALCYDRYSTWKGRCLYLEDIVVTEAARGQGIGERLFRTCVQHAAAEHYRWMRWQVLDWNRDAIRFYERFGARISTGWLNGELTEEQLIELATP